MKKHFILILLTISAIAAQAQYRLTYTSYARGVEDGEKSITQILQSGNCIEIKSLSDKVQIQFPVMPKA